MYMNAQTYLWMVEQDRERAMAQRALERAARSGGEQRPGLARGGITSVAKLLRQAGTTITQFTIGGPSRNATLSGSTGS
jgi:hypothetical protein